MVAGEPSGGPVAASLPRCAGPTTIPPRRGPGRRRGDRHAARPATGHSRQRHSGRGNDSRPDLSPCRHARLVAPTDALPGRWCGQTGSAARRGGRRHGRRGLSRRQRRPCPLPGLALGLRRALSKSVGPHSATAALRGPGFALRLRAVDGAGERQRLRTDACPRFQRGPPGAQLEPARAHGRERTRRPTCVGWRRSWAGRASRGST